MSMTKDQATQVASEAKRMGFYPIVQAMGTGFVVGIKATDQPREQLADTIQNVTHWKNFKAGHNRAVKSGHKPAGKQTLSQARKKQP
jgi:hypothetical protein